VLVISKARLFEVRKYPAGKVPAVVGLIAPIVVVPAVVTLLKVSVVPFALFVVTLLPDEVGTFTDTGLIVNPPVPVLPS
jgi:hypothetical protein